MKKNLLYFGILLSLLGSRPASSISRSFNLKELVLANSATAPLATFYKRLLQATGYLGSIDSDPIVKSPNASEGHLFRHYRQSSCSAIYVERPALFLTLANCFTGGTGDKTTIERYRRYSKVFFDGVGYRVDSSSIVIHSDSSLSAPGVLALFSLEPDEIATFEATHTPIPLVPEDSWSMNGLSAYLVAFGAKNASGKEFGTPQIKRFVLQTPNAQELRNEPRIGPNEKVLTFGTGDGSPGVSCPLTNGCSKSGHVLNPVILSPLIPNRSHNRHYGAKRPGVYAVLDSYQGPTVE